MEMQGRPFCICIGNKTLRGQMRKYLAERTNNKKARSSYNAMDHDGPNIIFSSGGLVDLSVAKKSDFL